MGRPRKPILTTGPTADMARRLRLLQDRRQYNIRQLSEAAGYSIATLSDAMGGEKLPSWPVTRSIVEACGGNVDDWYERWALAEQHNIIKGRGRLRSGLSTHDILTVVAGPPPVPPGDVDTIEDFMKHLHRVRIWAGYPPVREIARRAEVPTTTMQDFIAHKKKDALPSIHKVFEYLKGCGVSSGEVFAEWHFHWKRLARIHFEPSAPPHRPRLVG